MAEVNFTAQLSDEVRVILSESDVEEGYSMLMRKAEAVGNVLPTVGQFDQHILLPCITPEEIEIAISICEHWADGRPVSFFASPPARYGIHLKYGFVGCKLEARTYEPDWSLDDVRMAMRYFGLPSFFFGPTLPPSPPSP
ncbi:MAG TPA: hypothetical protein VK149_12400 [Sideroxyarcus sp.]|nr:hypothetical protein [Sideroxyarcus sp.]